MQAVVQLLQQLVALERVGASRSRRNIVKADQALVPRWWFSNGRRYFKHNFCDEWIE